jgi:hypothetical protein
MKYYILAFTAIFFIGCFETTGTTGSVDSNSTQTDNNTTVPVTGMLIDVNGLSTGDTVVLYDNVNNKTINITSSTLDANGKASSGITSADYNILIKSADTPGKKCMLYNGYKPYNSGVSNIKLNCDPNNQILTLGNTFDFNAVSYINNGTSEVSRNVYPEDNNDIKYFSQYYLNYLAAGVFKVNTISNNSDALKQYFISYMSDVYGSTCQIQTYRNNSSFNRISMTYKCQLKDLSKSMSTTNYLNQIISTVYNGLGTTPKPNWYPTPMYNGVTSNSFDVMMTIYIKDTFDTYLLIGAKPQSYNTKIGDVEFNSKYNGVDSEIITTIFDYNKIN